MFLFWISFWEACLYSWFAVLISPALWFWLLIRWYAVWCQAGVWGLRRVGFALGLSQLSPMCGRTWQLVKILSGTCGVSQLGDFRLVAVRVVGLLIPNMSWKRPRQIPPCIGSTLVLLYTIVVHYFFSNEKVIVYTAHLNLGYPRKLLWKDRFRLRIERCASHWRIAFPEEQQPSRARSVNDWRQKAGRLLHRRDIISTIVNV